MSLREEGGKVAAGFIDALKTQPLALALVICNVLLLALFAYVIRVADRNRDQLMEMQRETQKMLYRCNPTTCG
jgi:uncharacterized protein (DUF2062 family)